MLIIIPAVVNAVCILIKGDTAGLVQSAVGIAIGVMIATGVRRRRMPSPS